MLQYLVWLIFIVSVALTAGSVVISSQLRNKYKFEILSTLLYYLVFVFAFGFYGIWGQVLIRTFLVSYISTEQIGRFYNFAMLLGLPFLVFAWLMLIQFAASLSGRKYNSWFTFGFLVLNISLLIIIGYLIAKANNVITISIIRNYYIAMNLLYTLLASLLIHFPREGKSIIHDYDRKIIAPVLFLLMIVQCALLLFLERGPYIGLIFIFVFFAGNTFLPLYFSYGTLLSVFTVEPEKNISFEEFCLKYEVSPRESDIVREICNGLSNKEISEKLFISLQTVKDHTHRIYTKTNVKSRVQLINLVKEVFNK
jgi:DNA-binding CsgD family transcriptional regulator